MIHHITLLGPRCAELSADMRLSALQPLLVPLYCGILAAASPGIAPDTAGANTIPEALIRNEDGLYNSTFSEHSISIPDLQTTKDVENIFITDARHLKLECNLAVDSMDPQINVSWRHGQEQIGRTLYTSNYTDNQWRTTYEFAVTDMNKTGDYMCIFSSVTTTTEVKGIFRLQVPSVHGGSKTLVSYIRDFIVLKCDTSTYKPLKWLWYKVTENEQVALNFSLDPKRYNELSEKANETKLHITDLSEGDSGSYICKAVFQIVESEGQVQINVLSYLVPLKVFFAIAAEVAILVTVIAVYEVISKKKRRQEDIKKDCEPMTQITSEDSSIAEASTARQRKV